MEGELRKLKDWYIPAPWGKIALVSWGDPSGSPVLLVHGREDSAATFIPLLQLLPKNYHYVAVDLPGNGKSDAFPTGVMLMRFTNVVAVEFAVKHLGWEQFIYIGHSLGSEIGSFYNAIYPGRVTKLVLLDPLPAWRKAQIRKSPDYFKHYIANYYENYSKQNTHDRVYSMDRAISAVKRARGVTKEQAEILLSRSMQRIGDDQYRLSWDRRQKTPATLNVPDEYYVNLFSANSPPTLVINATDKGKFTDYIEGTVKLMENIRDMTKNYFIMTFEGDHDLHFKNPERFINELLDFLAKDFGAVKAKL